jgi:pimeloyl-ACP methyl ester carboxylesterase
LPTKRFRVLQLDAQVTNLRSGGALHVEGLPGAPAILFLHGVGGGAWSWRPQRANLASRYRIFSWDARGHGVAARVEDAGLADYYVDANEALSAAVAETGGPVFIGGHSMGGLLAIALAADRPADTRGLFLVDPVYTNGSQEAYGHFVPAVGPIARWLCEPLLRSFERGGKLSRTISRWMFEQSFEDRERMEEAWADQRTQIPVEYPRMLRESFVRPIGFEMREFADDIVAPTMLVEAGKPGGRPRFPALVDILRRRLGDRFVIESLDGGHYLQLDRPVEVNDRLARFLEASLR